MSSGVTVLASDTAIESRAVDAGCQRALRGIFGGGDEEEKEWII